MNLIEKLENVKKFLKSTKLPISKVNRVCLVLDEAIKKLGEKNV
jgi:uncharacterized protein YabE (DUF348 family)